MNGGVPRDYHNHDRKTALGGVGGRHGDGTDSSKKPTGRSKVVKSIKSDLSKARHAVTQHDAASAKQFAQQALNRALSLPENTKGRDNMILEARKLGAL